MESKKSDEHNKFGKSKTNRKSFRNNLSEYLFDYSSNSSLQGLKYLGEKNRSIVEKLFWLICLSVSIYLCVNLINKVYYKWQNTPVIVTFANNLVPVWEVPFPAVTICPENKNEKSLYNYTDAYIRYFQERESMTEQELIYFEHMNHVCADYSIPNGKKIIGNDAIDFIVKVAPTYDEWRCRWDHSNGMFHNCNTLMTPILTDDGMCFTFNMLDQEEFFTSAVYQHKAFLKHGIKSTNWTLENGYPEGLGFDVFPRRASAGFALTFAVALPIFKPDLDYGCRGYVKGFKILLHNPTEMPRIARHFFMASFDKQVVAFIKPEVMTTPAELNNYNPQQRQCYFSYERQLKYFKVYTQSNCELECLTNHTLKKCGCVGFYMPRANTTAICGRGNILCIDAAEQIMNANEMKLKNINYKSETEERCNCLPACTSLSYNIETSEVDHDWLIKIKARYKYDDDMLNLYITQLFFTFKDQYFIATERNELYGLTDFIANCGGLLGLFTGFSFLSIIEIIYFLTLRLVCNMRTHGFYF